MNLPESEPESQELQGRLLFASPTLHGDIFDRSVILLSEHSPKDGAFGLILNRPTGQVVGDVLKDPLFHPLRNIGVHHGGPVGQNNLFFAALWWESSQHLRIKHQISAEDAIKHHQQPGTLVRASTSSIRSNPCRYTLLMKTFRFLRMSVACAERNL